MKIGIVGAEAKKFTLATEAQAKRVIEEVLVAGHADAMVSGGCHLGGVDIWAEEVADRLGIPKIVHLPRTHHWSTGYKPRNKLIAKDSAVVHCIVVRALPPNFSGRAWTTCYHCLGSHGPHIKSGGCWTAIYARDFLGKGAVWHILG